MKPIVHEQAGVRVAVAVQVIHPQPSHVVARRAAGGAIDGACAIVVLAGRFVAGCAAVVYWGVCRVAQLLLRIESGLGGSHRRLTRIAYWLQPTNERAGMEVHRGYD